MSPDLKSNGRSRQVEGVLRYPDGSVDIAAYAKLAHRQRDAAIAALAREGIRRVREMWSAVGARIALVARSEAVTGKHHTTARR